MRDLNELIDESINVLREAKAKYNNIVILWAGGKDSTSVVHLAKKAYYDQIPQTILLDTTFQFRETYKFLEETSKLWNVPFERVRYEYWLRSNPKPYEHPFECCNYLKTVNLINYIQIYNIDCVIEGIRRDEQEHRNKEEFFSPRNYPPKHTRCFPILNWSMKDVWRYIRKFKIPYNPLYDRIEDGMRYKSIGCWPCTKPVPEKAREREGRQQDKELLMERLRDLGYM